VASVHPADKTRETTAQKMRISTTIRLIEFLRDIVARAGLIDISTLILAVCIVI